MFKPSTDGGTGNQFVMQADGSGVTDLGVAAFQADWSPDDTKLAAVVDRNIISPGSGFTQLTGVTCERFVDSCFRLRSPDGSLMAFVRLFVMNAGGTGVRSVTTVGIEAGDAWPSWGPAAPWAG